MRKMSAVCLFLLLTSPYVALAIPDCEPLSITREEWGKIAEKLLKKPVEKINYTYNRYRCCPVVDKKNFCVEPIKSGYKNGHSGWDVQTKSVALGKTEEEPFFSLTYGTVIRAGGDKYNTIAVYNSVDDRTTLYLHARQNKVYVSEGDIIRPGIKLGIQGNTSKGLHPPYDTNTNEHVHIEVHKGESEGSSPGAGVQEIKDDQGNIKRTIKTIDPLPYLHAQLTYYSLDVNGDGEVDQDDPQLVWKKMFSISGEERYSPECDVNSDGVIDLKDMDEFVKYVKHNTSGGTYEN